MAREADRSQDSEHRHQHTATRAPLPASEALHIQRTAGNSALVQLLRQAGHSWAQEQHQHSAGCGHQQNTQAEQPSVQRSAVHDALRTSGCPLDEATRTDMEARLGADFSDVRVHDDSAARASAAEIGARAYTSGSHVVIGDGGTDKHTLAHELTHVIQQRQGPVAGTDNGSGLKVSDPSDRYEREAEANATRVMRSALPEASHELAERDQQAVTEGAVVQRVIGQNNSTEGVDHGQGEHVFNNVSSLVNDFRDAVRQQVLEVRDWVNRTDGGKMHSREKRQRVITELQGAFGQLPNLSQEVATTLDTYRRNHQYGTVASGLGDHSNAEVFGLYRQSIMTLLGEGHSDRFFQYPSPDAEAVNRLRSARDNSIVDTVALGHVRTRFGENTVNGSWYTEAKAAMDRAFTAIFTALEHMVQVRRIIEEESAEQTEEQAEQS
ncbi:DUF4157 domain-containing protein [Streptomyces sp. NPDC058861]|uniref:eCIS core domain-containing protein n=1 Tax=Streptomyces sp. NPDC058861 TaxID=3346653 RepID=UPI003698BC5A